MTRIARLVFWLGLVLGQSNGLGRQLDPTVPHSELPLAGVRYQYTTQSNGDFPTPVDLDYVATPNWRGVECELGPALDGLGRCDGIAKYCKGSTGVAQTAHWHASTPGNVLSDALAFRRTCSSALVHETPTRLVQTAWAVWNLWEEDALAQADTDAFQTNCAATFARLRQEVHHELPIVIVKPLTLVGTLGGRIAARVSSIRSQVDALVAADANAYAYDPDDDSLALEGDNVHWTADSQQTAGASIATILSGISLPDYSSGVTRVSTYDSLAAAQDAARFLRRLGDGGGSILTSPVDTGAWAVTDPIFGHDFVPTGAGAWA